jgi:hypothetical protein
MNARSTVENARVFITFNPFRNQFFVFRFLPPNGRVSLGAAAVRTVRVMDAIIVLLPLLDMDRGEKKLVQT